MRNSITFCSFVIVVSISLFAFTTSSNISSSSKPFKDTPKLELEAMEVLTSQQLVVVKASPAKGKDSINFEAKLRDCFKVIGYSKDHSSTMVLDWTACPDGKCPEAKAYYQKDKDYVKLKGLIKKFISN